MTPPHIEHLNKLISLHAKLTGNWSWLRVLFEAGWVHIERPDLDKAEVVEEDAQQCSWCDELVINDLGYGMCDNCIGEATVRGYIADSRTRCTYCNEQLLDGQGMCDGCIEDAMARGCIVDSPRCNEQPIPDDDGRHGMCHTSIEEKGHALEYGDEVEAIWGTSNYDDQMADDEDPLATQWTMPG